MPETPDGASIAVPPRLVISTPTDEDCRGGLYLTNGTNTSYHRRPTRRTERKPSASEWIDVDDSPPQRRKTHRRTSKRTRKDSGAKSVVLASTSGQKTTGKENGGFFPKLSRILESTESRPTSSGRSKRSEDVRDCTTTVPRRGRRSDEAGVGYRRSARHKYSSLQRRPDRSFNPSLLSVLSGLTSASDRSSGSNSTITQQSYDRRCSDSQRTPTGKPRRPELDVDTTQSELDVHQRPRSPNVFDFMQTSTAQAGRDDHSDTASSLSSQYQHSDAGSSEAPGTPSSRSTFPSPTATRSTSVAELRRRYDRSYAASTSSVGSTSPDPSVLHRRPSVSEAVIEDDEPANGPRHLVQPEKCGRRRSSHSSQEAERRLHQQEEALRHHIGHARQTQHVHHNYPQSQQRSTSMSSAGSAHDVYAQHVALQQYQQGSPPVSAVHSVVMQEPNGHIAHAERPPAPDAPDLSRKTLAGYEMLASELSCSDSSVKPLYRRYEYLNHRILLHLQDELSELEEQLRTLDEIIAQMDPALAEGLRTPASRRGEAYAGHDIYHRRRQLLGHIFMKTDQYNRALASFAAVQKESMPANEEQVSIYRNWMAEHRPVHEAEARFLHHDKDLVVPCKSPVSISRPAIIHAGLAYLPVVLLLPLLLFSLIPSLASRLLATALVALVSTVVLVSTRLRQLLSIPDWTDRGTA